MRSALLKVYAEGAKEILAKVEEAEARLFAAGYEFKGGSYIKSEQYMGYRAKLDEIHETAMRLKGRK